MTRRLRAKVPTRKLGKFGAKRTMGSDGVNYDSKAERNYGEKLLLLQRAGKVRLVLRQVPFHLPGGVKMVLDFVWVGADGAMHFEDVKSPPTAAKETFRAKKRMVEQLYDVSIDVVWGKA